MLGVAARAAASSTIDLIVDGPAVRAFQDAVRRRAVEREPVAYIVGRRGFRRLELAVDRRALVPRPETELLVEVGLELPRGARVLDLGTGCGAVALALKDERPDLHVTASDISEDALELARANGRAARPGGAVAARRTCSTGVPDEFDAILANLPYVAESERAVAGPRDPPPRAARGAVRGAGRAGGDPRAARPGSRARSRVRMRGAGGRRRAGARGRAS